jgi:hypothetical protein
MEMMVHLHLIHASATMWHSNLQGEIRPAYKMEVHVHYLPGIPMDPGQPDSLRPYERPVL